MEITFIEAQFNRTNNAVIAILKAKTIINTLGWTQYIFKIPCWIANIIIENEMVILEKRKTQFKSGTN